MIDLNNNIVFSKYALWVLLLVTLQACNITKFLNEDELLVRDISLSLEGTDHTIDNSNLKSELESLYRVRPNNDRKAYNYYKYQHEEDPPWIRKWLKNKRSEAPSLLDSLAVEETAVTLKQYLRNKKGFYTAEVEYDIARKPRLQRADIEFKVNTGKRYVLNDIKHISRDTSLVDLIADIAQESILKKGDPIDALTFDIERQRIVSRLRKAGYADFNRSNVDIQGDSTDLDKAWDIFYVILPVEGKKQHQRYKIGDINIYTDFHQQQNLLELQTEERYDKFYHRESQQYIVKPSALDRKIFLKKYEVYNSENYSKTLQKLYNLGTYRFARIKKNINQSESNSIDYDIILTPYEKKWILDLGLESFFSTLTVTANDNELVGFAVSAGLEDRNAFRGSEKFKTSVQAGVEFNPSRNGQNGRLITSRSLGFRSELQIPAMTRPLNIIRGLHNVNMIKDNHLRLMEQEGTSNIGLGINYIDIINIYTIFTTNVEYGYEFRIDNRNSFTFNQIGINYTDYFVPPNGLFNDILRENPVLRNSFVDNLFTGFLFKDISYAHNTDRGTNRSNWVMIPSMELSGLEIHLANKLANLISGKDKVWRLFGDTEFEQMIKLGFDFRWYSRKWKKSQLAARIKTGAAFSFGSDENVSFVKQYFVGGPSSLRAWRPMHVGPGIFVNDDFFEPTDATVFFQRSDVSLEMNIEYRFDLLWLMEGAVFLDTGNIWTNGDELDVNGQPIRPGSRFSADFLSQLAIGYGYGIRFDFSYFLIRFDMGLKLKYPSNVYSVPAFPRTSPDSKWISPKGQGLGNFNIAVAYPF